MYKTIDACLGGILFIILMMGFLVLGEGCGKNLSGPRKSTLAKKQTDWKPGPRCKILGAVRGKYMDMTIMQNCLRNGFTTVTFYIHDVRNEGKEAIKEAVQAMLHVLGFRPKLAPLVITKIKGKPVLIFIMLGES